MQFDYSKLLGRIKECGYTQEKLAQAIGISGGTMSQKINNKANFNQPEMQKMMDLLNIADAEVTSIFFNLKVEKNATN